MWKSPHRIKHVLGGEVKMSVFTNDAPERTTEYVAAVLDLLGDRTPEDVLRGTAE